MRNSCSVATLDRTGPHPVQSMATIMPGLAMVALFGMSPPAHAVDGCTVLLCFAAPSWRSIPQCVPPDSAGSQGPGPGQAVPDVRNGRPMDTSMGLSPLEWLVMATRCGDVDPGLMTFLQRAAGIGAQQLE